MTINEHNYESYLLDYVDGELPEAEQKLLLQYIAAHPGLEEELQWLQKTRPETTEAIPFPDKTLLYRKENSRKKVIFFPWKKITVAVAAAACLLFGLWYYFGKQESLSPASKAVHPSGQLAITNRNQTENNPQKQTAKKEKSATPQKHKNQLLAIQSENNSSGSDKSPAPTAQQEIARPKERQVPLLKGKIAVQQAELKIPEQTELAEPVIAENPPARLASTEAANHRHSEEDIITQSFQKLNRKKEDMDSTLTNKLMALQNKLSHPIKTLNIKKIKIGNLSFVFN